MRLKQFPRCKRFGGSTALLAAAMLVCACGAKKSTGDESTSSGQAPVVAPGPAAAHDSADTREPTLLAAGAVAPDFSTVAHDGKAVALSKIKGPVVLYFYPKDETPG